MRKTDKKPNAIVRGIPRTWDDSLIGKCSDLFRCPQSDIVLAERLQRKTRDDSSADSVQATNDDVPIRVVFRNSHAKSDVYKRRFKLKVSNREVYFSNDLTKIQMTKRKDKVKQYQLLRKKQVRCSLPYDEILDSQGAVMTERDITTLLSQQ